MLARIQECILYRGFSDGEILNNMAELINLYESDEEALKAKEDQFFKSINGLVELAGMYGFSGNIWHTYLTFLLVNHENAFSMASEIRGAIKGSINDLAKNDFQIFKELYDFDITVFDRVFGTVCCKVICDYQTPDENSKLFNTRIRDRICQMSKTLAAAATTEEFMDDMVSFYKDFGVGKLGLHKAFRIDGTVTPARIVPITNMGERMGTVVFSRADESFDSEEIMLGEYGAAISAVQLLRMINRKAETEARKKNVVQLALEVLSYSELEAVKYIFGEIEGSEGFLIASKLAEEYKLTRSVIVNALRKLESAGVIDARSLGMKGTYIKVLNDYLYEELEKV